MQKIDPEQLNARAFGEDPIEDKGDSSEKDTADASQAESAEKKDEAASEPEESVVEEQKVPYSRLRTAIERSREAERKAEDANRRLAELESRREEPRQRSYEPYEEAIASRIKKLYGDNETSKQIIEIEMNRYREDNERLEKLAEQKAMEALDRRETISSQEVERNERTLESRLEDFSMALGRDLTADEENNLLAIADQYSPIGEDGKYLSGEPLPLDRAWEIYEMKQASEGQASKKSRSKATSLTSSKSEGETEIESGDSDKWYPGRWRDRIRQK